MAATSVPGPTHRRVPRLHVERDLLADVAAYGLVTAGIYVAQGFLWYYSAKEKLIDDDGTMPAGLKKQFSGHFLDSIPGLNAAWVMLGIMEAVIVVGLAISLLRGEFLPARRKPILLTSLAFAILTIAAMAFAETMVSAFDSVANLFGYFTATAVAMVLVLLMPPYRPIHWLSGLGGARPPS